MEKISPQRMNRSWFSGVTGNDGPPRTESAAAVSDCKRAGICPVMITGDHKVTAAANLQRESEFLDDISQACEGVQIDGMSDEGA